jgi:CHASE2 domain-containing sensor protein
MRVLNWIYAIFFSGVAFGIVMMRRPPITVILLVSIVGVGIGAFAYRAFISEWERWREEVSEAHER